MKKKQIKKRLVLLLAALFMLTACTKDTTPTTLSTTAEVAESSRDAASENKTSFETDDGEVEATRSDDPYGKYTPAIDMHAVASQNTFYIYPDGIDQYNNVWIDGYRDDLGINLIWDWLAESDFETKLNVQIAANTLPDVFYVNSAQFKILQQNGQIQDLTSVYEEHVSDLSRRQMEDLDDYGFKTAWIDGKLMALPIINSSYESCTLLWLRQDWLEALDLPEPKTMQDLIEIAYAFTNDDPDKNGVNDTYGLAVANDLYNKTGTYVFSLQGFFNGYHTYPSGWIDDGNGNITYGTLDDKVKEPLQVLQQMYSDGVIDPTFGVKDKNTVVEDTTAGRVGIEFGHWWNTDWPLSMCRANIPESDWKAYLLPSVDNETARPLMSSLVSEYCVVRTGYEYPEAVVKMLNYEEDKRFTTDAETYAKYIQQDNPDGSVYEWNRLSFVYTYDANQNPAMCYNISEALDTGDTSKLTLEQQSLYTNVRKYMDGEEDNAQGYMDFRRYTLNDGAYGQLLEYVEGKRPIQFNEYYLSNSDLMSQRLPALDKMEYEVMTRIIMGDPISQFDQFVSNWKAQGGDEILKEMNEWYLNN